MAAGRAVIRAVIFDYGGVVHRESREDYEAIDTAFGLPRGVLWSAIHDIPEYKLSREGNIKRSAYDDAVRRTLCAYTDDIAATDALRRFHRRAEIVPPVDAPMIEILRRLRSERRIRLGLLSNGFRGGTERLRSLGVTEMFDDVVVSGDVGLSKPDAAVYLLAARRLGVYADACLMIDDQSRNVEGALRAGLRAHLFEREGLSDLIRRLTEEGCIRDRGD